MREITIKSHSDHRKHKYELAEEPKKQVNRISIEKKLAVKFSRGLGFKQYDIILTKEQSLLTKIMSSFEGENTQTQYNILNYRIDVYFHDCKLAIEIDENGHIGINIDYEIKR